LSGCIFATKACIDNRKNLLNSNISSTCSHNIANFGPLTAEICSGVWRPSKFQRVSCLAFVAAATSLTGDQPNCARYLAVSWAGTHYRPYIHFRGLLSGVKFTLRPSLAFSYTGSITERHSSSGRQLNFAAWYKEWNCQTFAFGASYIRQGGHHVGHRTTF